MQKLRRSSADSIKPSDHIRLFVQDVIDFSSQYGKENTSSYTVANIRSRPHYYPKYGDFLGSFWNWFEGLFFGCFAFVRKDVLYIWNVEIENICIRNLLVLQDSLRKKMTNTF